MDFSRLLNMVARIFLRKAITKGVDMATRAGRQGGSSAGAAGAGAKGGRGAPAPGGNSRELVKRARQAARIARRFGR